MITGFWISTATKFWRKLKKTIKYSDKIIVDSKNTKNDLLRLYPQINKNNVYVIYPGIDERFKPINDKKKFEKVLKKYLTLNSSLLTSSFLLYVGAIEPRKNLDLAIDVFHQLIADYRLPITKHQPLITNFIITGRAGWKNENVFKKIKDLKLENKVKFIGFVEDEDLPYIYNAAALTVYLSTYEGF